MRKIPLIFKRNPENMREILNESHLDCLWVLAGEGVATRKYNGTACKVKDGKLFKRREIKKGKIAPAEFVEEMEDSITGKKVGWVPVTDAPDDIYHVAAFDSSLIDGTYELLGPKVQGNPEKFERHILISHTFAFRYLDAPRSFHSIREWFKYKDIEGIVFHHPDGRMAKIRKKDFGLKRVPETA